MTDVHQDSETGLQNQGGGTSLGANVSLEQSQDLEQITDREQCQNMDPNASYGQDSGSSLDQNFEQNINTCGVASPDSPTAESETNEQVARQVVSEETLQGGSSIAYGQTTDANSANILPPPYAPAMVGDQMPVSSAVVPMNMGGQSLPIQMGAPNLGYQHTETVTAITVINPSAVQVTENPVHDVMPSEEERGFCFWCCLCLNLTWDCLCCLCKCLCCIISCLLPKSFGNNDFT